jgi:hypothetical protein
VLNANDLPESLRKLFDEHQELVNSWLTNHAAAIERCNADDVMLGQLSYASQRDAGQLDPDPRDSMCRQCGRMEMLELAALKLWIELLRLRGSSVLQLTGKASS